MTPEEARHEYALHADEPRHIDRTTFGLWIALGLLGWLLVAALVAGAVQLWQLIERTFS